MRVRVGLGTLALCAALFVSRHGAAQEQRTDPAAADELFREGRSASEKHDYLTACSKFRESNRLDPAVGTLFNIADCEEKLGRLATAWTTFQEVAQRLPTDDDRRAIALKRAQGLEARVPRLSVHLLPPSRSDVSVRRDGVELGAASLDSSLPVNPGEHVVIVEAPGTKPAVFRQSVGEGERAKLDVSPGSALAAGESAGTSSPPSGDAGPNHTAAYVVGGVGIAGLVTGVVAGLITLNHKSTVNDNCVGKVCNQAGADAADSGKTWGVITTVGLVTGAVALGTATYLFVSAPAPHESARSAAYTLGIRATW